MSIGVIFIILITASLRREMRTAARTPALNKKLLAFLYGGIGTLVLGFSIPQSQSVMEWVNTLFVAAFLNFLLREDQLKSEKYLVVALIPMLAVMLVHNTARLVSPSLYNEWKTWFNAADSFAIIWAFGIWGFNRKQLKELAKAKEKAYREEQNNLVITKMKEELEIQVADRTAELTRQKEELELTLAELKATQTQLIHSEKMASLGELTAGIAHEIQNPLNFVNNFSEVNRELIEEIRSESSKPETQRDPALIESLLKDISENEDKINFHGKRADAIVKGMLQHSRSSSGQKEPTDLNSLAEEYLRLSYHGLRARDKSFNAKFETRLDPSIGKINMMPQEMGRVILNLINNAFYASNEKKKTAGPGYEPVVTLSTKKLAGQVELKVRDNGNGIPAGLIDKIFQPFFTTKPTGEGTGLGLSISYDIVTKGHGGELQVESREGDFTEFTILLPA